MQIKLTDKAREALLLAELVAWARKDTFVQIDDLCWALCQQQETTARRVKSKLSEQKLEFLGMLEHQQPEAFINVAPFRTLKFGKIPLGDAIFRTLEKCSHECGEIGYDAEITTGQILAQIVFDSLESATKEEKAKLDLDEFKSTLLSIAVNEKYVQNEITAGKSCLSKYNRLALNWLRDGNLTEQLKIANGLKDAHFGSQRILRQLFNYLGESENREIPEVKPPYSHGIRDKARRDLEVIDSFVAARDLPESEPNLLGMYINNTQEVILFYEDYFTLMDGLQSASLKYSDRQTVETFYHEDDGNGKEVASIAITGGDSFEFEMEIPAVSNDIHDVFLLEHFLENTRSPQAIHEIESNADYVAFLNRQSENLDLYYRLTYKVNELWQLGCDEHFEEDEEKGAEHIMLLRLLAILSTLPLRAVKPSASGLY